MAEQINNRSEYIRNFALNVSHEFKTPITSIQGTLELFQNYLQTMSNEKKQRFLNNMLEDTNRLKKLVNRLLEMAKADVFQPGDDTTEAIARLEQIRERYQEKGLNVTLTGDSAKSELSIAPEIFDTILSNMLDNSLQHKADQVTITISTDKELKLEVTDNGEGISDANATQIFTPFFSTTRKSGGTGLGLPIIKTLLQTHEGNIEWIAVETGTRFDVTIPIKTEAQ
jgi:signal transduction histidine kinase